MASAAAGNSGDAVRQLPDGSTEEVGWYDVDGERVYHVTRVPAGTVRGWVVLCPSIGGEFDGGYRRQTLLGRAAVEAGIASRRLHYRGTGNSHLTTVTTAATMLADVTTASEAMAARFPDATSILLGERIGAFAATEAAATVRADALVLWQPVADGEAYKRELSRAAKLQDVVKGVPVAGGDGGVGYGEGYDQGEGDLVGFAVPKPLIESFLGRTLAETSPGSQADVRIVQFGRKKLDPRFAKLVAAWEGEVATIDTQLLTEPELWWFAPGPWRRGEEGRPVNIEALAATEAILRKLVSRREVVA